MFRISVLSRALGTSLTLEGKLNGPGIEELESCWDVLAAVGGKRPLCVALTYVTCVSVAGKELLESMSRDGAVIIEHNQNAAFLSTTCEPRSVAPFRERRLMDKSVSSRRRILHRLWTAVQGGGRLPEKPGQRRVAAMNWTFVFLPLTIGFAASDSTAMTMVAKSLLCFVLAIIIGWLIASMRSTAPK